MDEMRQFREQSPGWQASNVIHVAIQFLLNNPDLTKEDLELATRSLSEGMMRLDYARKQMAQYEQEIELDFEFRILDFLESIPGESEIYNAITQFELKSGISYDKLPKLLRDPVFRFLFGHAHIDNDNALSVFTSGWLWIKKYIKYIDFDTFITQLFLAEKNGSLPPYHTPNGGLAHLILKKIRKGDAKTKLQEEPVSRKESQIELTTDFHKGCMDKVKVKSEDQIHQLIDSKFEGSTGRSLKKFTQKHHLLIIELACEGEKLDFTSLSLNLFMTRLDQFYSFIVGDEPSFDNLYRVFDNGFEYAFTNCDNVGPALKKILEIFRDRLNDRIITSNTSTDSIKADN